MRTTPVGRVSAYLEFLLTSRLPGIDFRHLPPFRYHSPTPSNTHSSSHPISELFLYLISLFTYRHQIDLLLFESVDIARDFEVVIVLGDLILIPLSLSLSRRERGRSVCALTIGIIQTSQEVYPLHICNT
jgi:hypothetical protein